MGFGYYEDHPTKERHLLIDDRDYSPVSSTPTMQEVRESATPVTRSEAIEVLRAAGADKIFNPYDSDGPGFMNCTPTKNEIEHYWNLMEMSPYPNGVCPEPIRKLFDERVREKFDLTPFEVCQLIDDLPSTEKILAMYRQESFFVTYERLVMRATTDNHRHGKSSQPQDADQTIEIINNTLTAVIREAELYDPHSLYNYERRERYEICGIEEGQPTGKWFDLAECEPLDTSRSVFRVRVGITYEAQEASIANDTSNSISSRFIRPRPTKNLARIYLFEEAMKLGINLPAENIEELLTPGHSIDGKLLSEDMINSIKEKARKRIGLLQDTTGQVSHEDLKRYVDDFEILAKMAVMALARLYLESLLDINSSLENATILFLERDENEGNLDGEDLEGEANAAMHQMHKEIGFADPQWAGGYDERIIVRKELSHGYVPANVSKFLHDIQKRDSDLKEVDSRDVTPTYSKSESEVEDSAIGLKNRFGRQFETGIRSEGDFEIGYGY
eukprot:CAMPEP_0167769870 /NCGR_PEP_ID=MMETSP0110_2-20121227/17576_1 /TAXON_ID=629695 /ORGANISM="Gymnochlora sp., Strain CCMP2014" /LENGTH=501 /DNA_ID=CAMNT_0007658929 /DNA_START=1338 /DNA_END=2844 /DNA_ORIENTATION=+